mgnify:CR=1 FL=1
MGISSFSVAGEEAMHLTPAKNEGYLYSAEEEYEMLMEKYGALIGDVEDILEEIVGDIQDEYDEEVPDIAKTNKGSYIVQGFVNLEDLGEELKHPFNEDFPEVDTVAGMILELAGYFPKEGQVFKTGDWQIETQKVENHRIAQVLITYVGEGENKNLDKTKEQDENNNG